eukprot:scaffold12110_cov48-Phaeocystis_antarctica.AAC.1
MMPVESLWSAHRHGLVQLGVLVKICFRVGDSGLEVRISLGVREAPGSRPGCPRIARFVLRLEIDLT